MVIETPISSLPIQNIASWTAAVCKITPTIAIIAVMMSPPLRPHLSDTVPPNGVAITEPRNTIATFRAAVAVVR